MALAAVTQNLSNNHKLKKALDLNIFHKPPIRPGSHLWVRCWKPHFSEIGGFATFWGEIIVVRGGSYSSGEFIEKCLFDLPGGGLIWWGVLFGRGSLCFRLLGLHCILWQHSPTREMRQYNTERSTRHINPTNLRFLRHHANGSWNQWVEVEKKTVGSRSNDPFFIGVRQTQENTGDLPSGFVAAEFVEGLLCPRLGIGVKSKLANPHQVGHIILPISTGLAANGDLTTGIQNNSWEYSLSDLTESNHQTSGIPWFRTAGIKIGRTFGTF